MKEHRQLVKEILIWYTQQRRNLPWRNTHTPYRILVSEVMLQQTQVDRVKDKYVAFLHTFPTQAALAHAKTADVIRAWSGLGYNRRALFLQKTAQAVETTHRGKFPSDLETLKTLPGVGEYTARAILSFAFDMPVPVMDTNHRKFYSRLFQKDISDKKLLVLAQKLLDEVVISGGNTRILRNRLPKKHHKQSVVYHWNQALMDFMSAVAKNHHHPLTQQFIYDFPALPKKKKAKKQTIPFRETDRFFRGRIIEALRNDSKISKRAMRAFFPDISDERFKKIIIQLENDGLIKLAGQSILLP
jgi:A/G-specific adenine glycosylase